MVQYHFRTNDGPSCGPIGTDEFQQRREAGEINDETMVWRSGMGDWMSYADLCTADQKAAEPQPPKLPVRRAKAAAAETSAIREGFCACASCRQEWPEALLTVVDGKRICGNCQNIQKAQARDGRKKAGEGTSARAWILIIVAIICTVCLSIKVKQHGFAPPEKRERAAELSSPSTYGK